MSADTLRRSRPLARGKRYIADTLSMTNLACGIASMVFAYHGHLPLSLLMLLLGGVLDGLDGAAARRWGGSAWGVYADDVADGVNYGLAPGFALWVSLGGVEGLVCGIVFALFTLGRLVYFTLNKADADPNFFSGVPSTVGGGVALTALILFPNTPALVGLMVGVACALMVSFDSLHRHMGRMLIKRRQWMVALPPVGAFLLVLGMALGPKLPAALILTVGLAYGFLPTALHFRRVIRLAVTQRGGRDKAGVLSVGGMG